MTSYTEKKMQQTLLASAIGNGRHCHAW